LVEFAEEDEVEDVQVRCFECERTMPLSKFLAGRPDGIWEYDPRCWDCVETLLNDDEADSVKRKEGLPFDVDAVGRVLWQKGIRLEPFKGMSISTNSTEGLVEIIGFDGNVRESFQLTEDEVRKISK
jgi:hypothetical protein